jgi:hypothetical protein
VATFYENLTTERDALQQTLTDAALNGPKPSYSNGPRSVSWTEWYRYASDRIKEINAQLSALQPEEYDTPVRAL